MDKVTNNCDWSIHANLTCHIQCRRSARGRTEVSAWIDQSQLLVTLSIPSAIWKTRARAVLVSMIASPT